MPIFTGNPNVVPPPAQFVPPRGTMPVPPWFFPWMFGMPGAEFQKPKAERFGPVPRGLLDQKPDIQQEIERGKPNPWAAQNVADIYSFTRKGLLGNPYTEMREPGAGGRGLLGSKWRDPRFIQQYETQQGLPPGSIKMPSAEVRQMPKNLDTVHQKALKEIDAETAARIAARQAQGPTSAQMARPVQQTPEISAKLAAARQARAASEGYRLVEDARAWMSANKGKKPFDSKVLADRYNKMDVGQQEIFSRIMFKDDPWFHR